MSEDRQTGAAIGARQVDERLNIENYFHDSKAAWKSGTNRAAPLNE